MFSFTSDPCPLVMYLTSIPQGLLEAANSLLFEANQPMPGQGQRELVLDHRAILIFYCFSAIAFLHNNDRFGHNNR